MSDLVNAFAVAGKALFGFQAIFFCLLAVGINVHFGYTGLLNFGQIAFAMLGGFGIAIAVSQWGLSFWVGVLLGVVASVVLALLLGIPTLRLRADYLAIVTIAVAEGLRLLFRSVGATPVTGGTQGLSAFNSTFYELSPWDTTARHKILGATWSGGELWISTVGWILVIIFSLLVWQLMRSPWGRVVKAIREDEDAVRALGKNVYSYKMQALVLGGVIGAFGGMVYAVATGSAIPDQYQNANTFLAYAALILGGAAPGARPGRRSDAAAVHPAVRRHRTARPDLQRGHPRHPAVLHRRGADPLRPGGHRAHAVVGVPSPGHLR